MAYIPEKHKKYDVLPMCRKCGGEVFSYPGKIMNDLKKYLPDGENMIPYGYDSYEQYMQKMDCLALQYFQEKRVREIYEQFKISMKEMNNKEDWSILRYIGKSDDKLFGLTHGNIYYWPCSKRNPYYEGVIDDEEFTSYWYSTEEDDWEILEDPTGMAYATIYKKKKGYTARKQYENVMTQVEGLMQETMINNTYEYTKVRDNIWQIAEDNGVYCTLVKGSKMAVLIDTGYGVRNLRAFVEENITTPYIVINSHGHPDHIGGNHWFDSVYALEKEWDVIKHFEENKQKGYELKEIQIGQHISLGNLDILVVSLVGHTKGSVGFIVQEEGILIAGDALNEGLWLFNYGSLSMINLYKTIKKTMKLDFSTYLCGHSDKEYNKEKLVSHIRNIENLKIDNGTKQDTMGFETYCSKYESVEGKSEIVFTIDKVENSNL